MSSPTIVSPAIVSAVRTPRWQSQIQRLTEQLDPTPTVHWIPGFDSVEPLVIANPSAVLIVELPESFSDQPTPSLTLITSLCNNAQQCPLFLLCDESAERWPGVLMEAGASGVCCSVLDFEKVRLQIERHLKNRAIRNLTVEETVVARLPW